MDSRGTRGNRVQGYGVQWYGVHGQWATGGNRVHGVWGTGGMEHTGSMHY